MEVRGLQKGMHNPCFHKCIHHHFDVWASLESKPSNGARLWDKLISATQTMADKIPNRDDKGPGTRFSPFGKSMFLVICS
jgi:hypothetical protein